MFCNKCGTEAVINAKFCSNCGGTLNEVSPIHEVPYMQEDPLSLLRGFFTKLLHGDYGLAKTYWLYGMLIGSIIFIVLSIFKSPKITLLNLHSLRNPGPHGYLALSNKIHRSRGLGSLGKGCLCLECPCVSYRSCYSWANEKCLT
jgi:zinc-ribbon domain